MLLDCTIRDGGYLTNWDFSEKFVYRMLRVLDEAGFAFAEIGFWSPNDQGKPWQHCSIDDIRRLETETLNIKVSLLLDYGKCSLDEIPYALIDHIGLIRIATRKQDILEAAEFASSLKKRGFTVSLNAMGITAYTPEDTLMLGHVAQDFSDQLDFLYVADSFGGLMPAATTKVFNFLSTCSDVPLGFHPHNNLELAVANTLAAIETGVSIVDSSILGLGRGGGNLRSEVIACVLSEKSGDAGPKPLPLLSFADATLDQIGKGLNLSFKLEQLVSGIAGCHPNYANALAGPQRMSLDEIFHAIALIPVGSRSSFSKDKLSSVMRELEKQPVGNSSALGCLRSGENDRAILLCPGATLPDNLGTEQASLFGVNWFPEIENLAASIFGSTRRLWQNGDKANGRRAFLLSNKSHLRSLPEHQNLDDSVVASKIGQRLSDSGIRAIAILFEAGYSHVDVVGMSGFKIDRDFGKKDHSLASIAEKEIAMLIAAYEKRGYSFTIHTAAKSTSTETSGV